MAKAYEMLYENLKPRLSACDLAASAMNMGLPVPANGLIHCDFLGRQYLISNSGVEKADDRPDNVNSRSLLVHYLLSEGGVEPTGEFVPMSQLTGMVPSQNAHDNFFAKPLLRALGKNYRGLITATESLGGALISSINGEHHWHFQVLPKIAMRFIHYEPDDEYPLEFKYLFGRLAIRILEYECLAFLIGCFNYELIEAIKRETP